MESEYKKLVTDANIGADVRRFLGGNVGQYLLKRAEMAEIEALRALGTVDPEDKAEIVKLQLAAATPRMFIKFMGQALRDGDAAAWQLAQEGE